MKKRQSSSPPSGRCGPGKRLRLNNCNQTGISGKADEVGARPRGPRAARLYLQEPQDGVCRITVPAFAQPVPYPSEARRGGVAGAVIVKVDVQENGLIRNMRILAAVPQRHFGDAIYGVGNRITFMKTKDATPGCSLAQKDKVFTYIFTMR